MFRYLVVVLCSLALLTGCGDRSPDSASVDPPATDGGTVSPGGQAPEETTTPEQTPPAEPERQTITVSTAQQFIDAVGSNRTITFEPGEYILSSVPDRHMDYVRWDPTTAGKTVTIRNVQNLRLESPGPDKVRLIVRPYSVFVLNFDNVTDCEIDGFTLGHAPEKGGCESGVMGIANSKDVRIRDCDLFGCGTEGLTIENCQRIRVERSTVRDCTSSIMTIEGSKDLQFTDCTFRENGWYRGVQIHDSAKVSFERCVFKENRAEKPLLNAVSASAVRIVDCEFSDNKAPSLTNDSSAFNAE